MLDCDYDMVVGVVAVCGVSLMASKARLILFVGFTVGDLLLMLIDWGGSFGKALIGEVI